MFVCIVKHCSLLNVSLYGMETVIKMSYSGLVNKNSATNAFLLAADWDHEVFFIDLLKEDPKASSTSSQAFNIMNLFSTM